MRNRNYRKGTNTLLLVIIIAVLLVAGVFFLKKTGNPISYTTSTQPTTQAGQAIQSRSDLETTANDLDNLNVDTTVDQQLKQNDADAQTFGPRIKLKNGTSLNWAGYAIETNLTNPQNNVVTDVKGSWVVPSLTCTNTNTYSAAWVGIDGYSDNSVEQTGTEHDCVNGNPIYSAWYEMYPKPSFRVNLSVKAGDTISAEVQYINKKFVLTLSNLTTGKSFTTTQKSNAFRQSAEWIMEAPWSGSILPLTNFGTMTFSNAQATLNATTGTISNSAWQNDALIMTTSSGTAKATPSALLGDGSNFSVTWNSN